MCGQPYEERRERLRQRSLPKFVDDTPYADWCERHGGQGEERWCAVCFLEEIVASKAVVEDIDEVIGNQIMALLSASPNPLSFFDIVSRIEYPRVGMVKTMTGLADGKFIITMRVLEGMMAREEVAELWSKERGEHTYRMDCSFSERMGL